MINGGENALLIHNPTVGVVRYITIDNLSDSIVSTIVNNQTFLDSMVSIIHDYGDTLLYNSTFISNLQDSIDTHLDSLTLTGNTLSGWVEGSNYEVDLTSLTGVDTSDIVNIIYNSGDTLLYNSTFLTDLQDSIDTHLDSITLNGTVLTGWVDGVANSVDLVSLIGTDDQNLTGAALTGNILSIDIENGSSTSVDLSALVGTDDQNLTGATMVGNTLTIDIENGASVSVDLSSLIGTDSQTLSLTGDNLSISNGNTVSLNSLKDHDWYVANTTSHATSINQDVFTNGLVGIGTNNPLSQLHVSGNALTMRLENTAGTTWGLNSTNAGDFRMINYTGTTIPMTILGANDYIGINITNPTERLHIFDGSAYLSNSTTLQSTVLNSDGGVELFRAPTSSISPNTNGYVDYKDVEADDYDFRTYYNSSLSSDGGFVLESTTDGQSGTAAARMVILNDNGNVGIGTITPTHRLEVMGDIKMDNTTSDGARFIFRGGTGGTEEYRARVGITGGLGFFPIEAGSPGYVGEPLVLTQDGKVGIGDHLTPFYALELKNQNSIFGQARAFGWVTYSDARVKSDRKPINNALATISKLNPLYYFHHNSEKNQNGIEILDEGGYSYGFLAQELYKELPVIVFKPEDESKDLWSVDYDKLIPILTKAIQEQQDQIESLRKEQEKFISQEEEIKLLRESLQELQKQVNDLTK